MCGLAFGDSPMRSAAHGMKGKQVTQSKAQVSGDAARQPRPGHKVIRLDTDGAAWIEGFRCPECGAVALEQTMACRSCAGRAPLEAFRSAETGSLYSWGVIHRSYPGIEVPFVSAIVDLDGGMTLKGTLRGIEPELLRVGSRLQVKFDDAGGAVDKDGAPYVGFHFVTEGGPE